MELPIGEIKKYYRLVIQRRYVFICVAVAVMSAFVWGSYFLPKKYQAQSTLVFEENLVEEFIQGVGFTPRNNRKENVNSLLSDAMKSRSIILKVVKDLDLDTGAHNDKELERIVANFQDRTTIKTKRNEFVSVSIVDENPRVARDYINALVRVYLEETAKAKTESTYGASRFLTEQVEHFKEKLSNADESIIKYRQEKGIYESVDEKSLLAEIKDYKQQLEDVETKKNELNAVRASIEKEIAGEKDATIEDLNKEKFSENNAAAVAADEKKLQQLLVSYNENHPEVVRLKAEIEALKSGEVNLPAETLDAPSAREGSSRTAREGSSRKGSTKGRYEGGTRRHSTLPVSEAEIRSTNSLYKDLKQRKIDVMAEIESVNAKETHIKALLNSKENELRFMPEGKKELADLEKERDTYKDIYGKLLTRVGETEINKQVDMQDKAATFRVYEPAVLPKVPVSPNRVQLIMVGIFFGLLGGFGGVLIREGLDATVKDVQVLRKQGLQVLAIIPRIFNEAEEVRVKKKDKVIYTVVGVYLLVICVALVHEMLGLSYIETMMVGLKNQLVSIVGNVRGII